MRTIAELTSGNSMTALGYGDTSKRVPKERAGSNSKMFEAIFQILKEENSLELIMSSYQLLNELDKPRVYTSKVELSKLPSASNAPELDMVEEPNPDPRIHAPTIAKVLLKSRGFFTKVFLNDIDAADVDNELAVVKYVEDIYKFYKLTEDRATTNSVFCKPRSIGIVGEAKSAQLIGQAIANNPAFITPRKIEAAREIAHTISNSANKVFLTSDELLLNLQETNLGTSTGQK
ncbi:uncharacterized protein LOC114278772 [Camellia sinensis]|uniref:uncharacterized protein LOC114278772 n=1 Tax=Camellia sinensis TaxID=4442 RepID=UPI0010356AC6|nr:uncharacterized protein LOC114278772 [Camellia sinensis]